MHSSNTRIERCIEKIRRSIEKIERCIEKIERSIEKIQRCIEQIQRSIKTIHRCIKNIQCGPDAPGDSSTQALQRRASGISLHTWGHEGRTPCTPDRTTVRPGPPQAPDTRALFRSDRQYAAVTPMPSSTASEPPMTATSFGAAIQNPA